MMYYCVGIYTIILLQVSQLELCLPAVPRSVIILILMSCILRSVYAQEIPQPHTADQPMAPPGRATEK